MKSLLMKLVVAVGASILASTALVGVASAEPDLSPLINTTCSYQQVVAAMNVQAPDLAAEFSNRPVVQSRLQKLLAAPPDQRSQMLATPQGQQYGPLLLPFATTCQNY